MGEQKTNGIIRYEAIIHLHTVVEDVTITELIAQIDMKTNQELKKKPTFVKSNSVVRCRLQTNKQVPVEAFATLPQMGRYAILFSPRLLPPF